MKKPALKWEVIGTGKYRTWRLLHPHNKHIVYAALFPPAKKKGGWTAYVYLHGLVEKNTEPSGNWPVMYLATNLDFSHFLFSNNRNFKQTVAAVESELSWQRDSLVSLLDAGDDEASEEMIVRKQQIVNAAVRWWEGNRPNQFTERKHVTDPTVMCKNIEERDLARAVAGYVRRSRDGQSRVSSSTGKAEVPLRAVRGKRRKTAAKRTR